MIKGRRKNSIREFHKKYRRTKGCWNWKGTILSTGYGQFSLNNKRDSAHRISYRTYNGEIPKGLIVRHTCDNRKCVNPKHLILGTQKDNAQDCIKRGRRYDQRGDKAPGAKLKASQVLKIRKRFLLGDKQRDIAKDYGITRSYVSTITNRRSWNHI